MNGQMSELVGRQSQNWQKNASKPSTKKRSEDNVPEVKQKMSTENLKEENLYQKAASLWGFEFQTRMMIEEMAELTTALCHISRNRGSIEAVMEEIADVEIVLNQMKIIFPSIEAIKKKKLERLALRVDEKKEY